MQASTNEFRVGMKVEIYSEPYSMMYVEFVKPGKGQAFTRVRLKHLTSGRVIEKTYKSGAQIKLADVEETKVRMLYREKTGIVFMNDATFDQISVPFSVIGDKKVYFMEGVLYTALFYKGVVIDMSPPIFMEMKVIETTPGFRGDTTSGRVLKPATTETGAKVQVPLFIKEGEVIKIDTRTGEYASRV